jgi:hypothetical protein
MATKDVVVSGHKMKISPNSVQYIRRLGGGDLLLALVDLHSTYTGRVCQSKGWWQRESKIGARYHHMAVET